MRIRPFNPRDLLDERDPIQGTPFVVGESVLFCRRSKVAYHETTVTFLVQANAGTCTGCGRQHDFERVVIPSLNSIRWRNRPTPQMCRVGPAVRTVQRVKRSATGAWLLELEPTGRDEDNIRLAVLAPSVARWTEAGISFESYIEKSFIVEGTVHDDPWLKRVIVITDPADLRSIDRPAIRWRNVRGNSP